MTQTRPRILAIDDTPANLITLGAVLASEFDLQIATSGAAGLALALQYPPDLILLDIMMPEMDGFEVCRRLKAAPTLCQIPVIFVTALDQADTEVKGLALGAADYISKPMNIEIARQRIRNLLERERLRAQVQAQVLQLQQSQQALRESEQQFRAFFQTNSSVLLIIDPTVGRITDANEAAAVFYGYSKARLVGMPVEQINPLASQQLAHAQQEAMTLQCNHFYFQHRRASGELREVEVYSTPVQSNGKLLLFSIVHDITLRKLAEEKLQLAASVFTHTREGIMITAANGSIVDVNDAFTRITGYDRDEVLGCNPRLLNSGLQKKEFYDSMWHHLCEQGYWYGEVWNRRKNGEVYVEMQTISSVRDASGTPQHYVALFSDVTASKEHEHQLERIAHYDALTQLPNRVLLADRLRQALLHTQRRSNLMAVAFLDLDGFKAINDHYGHEAGDQLLISVGVSMKKALREGDTLARIGGDEFVAVLVDLVDVASSGPLFNRLLQAAAQPVPWREATLQVSASLGVTFYPQAGVDVEADLLLRQADQAMYTAKQSGKNRCYIFDTKAV